jgi:predicted phage terminase large subunit-like protein
MKFATPDITALEQYDALISALDACSEAERVDRMRHLCRTDLFFLVRYVCNRLDLHHPFFFDRCRELQAAPDGYCDLWAREHGKSSLGTFGLSLFHIINDPEVTIGIFSHTRPIAKSFLRQIKRELEVNEVLKGLFPEIFWENPTQQASKWSEDDGLVWKREGNPKESGLEAWGLVDGMPTGRHFRVRVYDDVVVPASVSTPEMVAKTTEAFQLSDNLGSLGGSLRVYGTRYAFGDSYEAMLASGMLKPRIYACTVDGTDDFAPENCRLMPPDVLIQKRQAQGPYVFAAQLLLNPAGDTSMGFRREWLGWIEGTPHAKGLSVYLVVDPAHSKKKGSDYTVICAIGVGHDGVYRLLDMIRDRLNLTERTEALFEMWGRWCPIRTGYERYGLQSDLEHIRREQHLRNISFPIVELGGSTPKVDRIRRLVPLFEQGKFLIPRRLHRTQHDGETVDLIRALVEEEFVTFPYGSHDDALDCMARILDPDMKAKVPLSDAAREARRGSRPTHAQVGYSSAKERSRRQGGHLDDRR